jgi:hypothetical protein
MLFYPPIRTATAVSSHTSLRRNPPGTLRIRRHLT